MNTAKYIHFGRGMNVRTERINTAGLRFQLLQAPIFKVGPWLASGNLGVKSVICTPTNKDVSVPRLCKQCDLH